MANRVIQRLVELLGEDRVFHAKSDLIPYCSDFTRIRSFEHSGAWPLCAVLPEDTEEVSAIVGLAAENRIPIIPRGGGSNQVGGVVPTEGSIVLSTSRMDKILEIDPVNFMVTAQPGVNLGAMDDALEPYGLILAQEQGSYKVANIGGAVSTNGYSLRHNRYGNIGDNVLSLEVVLGDGRILRTGRRVCSNSSGYPLHKLFVGAEGTLGIITELTLRVMPKPERELPIIALFDSWDIARATAMKILCSGIDFSGGCCLNMRDETLGWINAIMIGIEGTEEEVEGASKRVTAILEENGGSLLDPDIAWEKWRQHRMTWCGSPNDERVEDDLVTVMPLQHYDEVHARFEKEVFQKYGIERSEGSNSRVITLGSRPLCAFSFTFDPKRLSTETLKEAFGEMMKIVAEYGGVGPGCHGVGALLADYMPYEHDKLRLEIMRDLKRLFDPYNIMNPGKKLPLG